MVTDDDRLIASSLLLDCLVVLWLGSRGRRRGAMARIARILNKYLEWRPYVCVCVCVSVRCLVWPCAYAVYRCLPCLSHGARGTPSYELRTQTAQSTSLRMCKIEWASHCRRSSYCRTSRSLCDMLRVLNG